MKTIQKSINITATKEKVWEVLFNDNHNRIWYAEFSAGTYADTDWAQGSKAVFTDGTGSGLVARVITNNPFEFLALKYEGILADNKEDYSSAQAKAIEGGNEVYKLSTEDGKTHLEIESDMAESYYEMMLKSWDRALEKIKALAESFEG